MRKKIAVAALLAAIVSPSVSAAKLVVAVNNIQNFKGGVYISLYNRASNFNYGNDALNRPQKVTEKSTIAINLGDIAIGEYSVSNFIKPFQACQVISFFPLNISIYFSVSCDFL